MIFLLFYYYFIYSYMVLSLVPPDAFFIIRPLFILILTLIFLGLGRLIKKFNSSIFKYLFIFITTTIMLLLIGKFARVNPIYSIILGLLLSLIILLLKRFKLLPLLLISLFFISGNGKEIEKDVTLFGYDNTYSIDASSFYSGKKGLSRLYNYLLWGFDKELPIRGNYSLPSDKGVFPIAFILHGNHLAEDDSSRGYYYIMKELNSHGYISVTLDHNFLNGDWTTLGVGQPWENDVRARLLLSSIELFKEFNSDENSPLYNRIDFTSVTAIGHSRGGEAVAIASSLSDEIDNVIALAPTFNQYKERVKIKNSSYLLITGASDGDVRGGRGINQYNSIKVKESNSKALIVAQDFNHTKFNSDWGDWDSTGPGKIFFKKTIDGDEQREFTNKAITNFLSGEKNLLKEATIDTHIEYEHIIGSDINLDYSVNRERWVSANYNSYRIVSLGKKNSLVVENQFEDGDLLFSIHNPNSEEVVLNISGSSKGKLIIKPKMKWSYLKYPFLEDEVDIPVNFNNYIIPVKRGNRGITLNTDNEVTLYIDSILHRKKE